MEKAYNAKELLKELKDRGLEVAEDAAEITVEAFFVWIEKSALKSENKYDDLIIAVLPMIKELAAKAVDKIDGETETAE